MATFSAIYVLQFEGFRSCTCIDTSAHNPGKIRHFVFMGKIGYLPHCTKNIYIL